VCGAVWGARVCVAHVRSAEEWAAQVGGLGLLGHGDGGRRRGGGPGQEAPQHAAPAPPLQRTGSEFREEEKKTSSYREVGRQGRNGVGT